MAFDVCATGLQLFGITLPLPFYIGAMSADLKLRNMIMVSKLLKVLNASAFFFFIRGPEAELRGMSMVFSKPVEQSRFPVFVPVEAPAVYEEISSLQSRVFIG